MVLSALLWIVLGALSLTPVSALIPRTDDIVDLGYVKYLGNRTYPNTNAFLGIPYAEPPVGERRFRAPVPLNTEKIAKESKGKVMDARSYANFCIQQSVSGVPNGAGTEDCLKVNIWAPARAKEGDNLPVLVYIHGGGYIAGHPNEWQFDHWVDQSPNVVIVSVGYRLGIFGFLATTGFNDPSVGDFNVGFKDQIQALKWVKKYISSFGGDPNRVTINGESAGGNSVQLHLIAHQDERLFSQAIAQSVWRAALPSPQHIQPLFEYIASRVGCTRGNVPEEMACLRGVSAEKLSAAHDSISTSFNGAFKRFVPTMDGNLFTDYPTQSFLTGKFTRVPLIVGATTNDSIASGTLAEAMRSEWPLLTDQDIEEIAALYPTTDFPTEDHRIRAIVGDNQFICSRSLMGGAYSQQPTAWTYRYNQPNPKSTWTQEPGQVGHAAENWMMFRGVIGHSKGTYEFTGLNAVETAFSEELIAYWLSFVRSGDPNTYKLARSPIWQRYTKANKARIVLQQDPHNTTTQSGSFLEVETEKETEICSFIYTKSNRQLD